MSKYIFILFALFPFFLFAQTPFLHEKEVARLYHSQQYEKALDLLLKIQDKDMDSPFTYKFDGTYRNNSDFYYYVVRSAFYVALKNTDEKLFKNNLNDFRHLCRISGPDFSKSDASFYNDFRNELIKRSERSMGKNNHSEAEEYSQFLVKSLRDTIDIYRKIFIPLYYNKKECTQAFIDSFASAKTPFALHSIEVLHSYLTYGLETDEQKIRAFYIWLISHIIYDYNAYRGKTYHKNAPFQIIYSGKAVCAGYANMFMELCQLSKIDCVYIVGWSKKDVLEPIDNSNCHAWNKVMYNGEWKLIDCTWSALGYDFFYCTPPEKFVATHFPFDPEYQLLSPPINIETFMNLKPIWF